LPEPAPHGPLDDVRAVVFDLDGTLVDSYAAITVALNAALRQAGRAAIAADEVRRVIGHGLEALVASYLPAADVGRGVATFRATYARVFLESTRPLPGALDALRTLAARGYGLAVASNKPTEFSRQLVEHLGVAPLLGAVLGPEAAGAAKPDPAMIHACLRALGVAPTAAIYVGDMTLDVESARRAGVRPVLVATGSSTLTALRATGAIVLAGLAELPALLPASATVR
jgi:phosphoglycolate phosphatase